MVDDIVDHPGFIGSARLGVSGESQVNDFFSVFGNVMYDLSAEDNIKTDKRMEIRYAWVGARFGEYGSLLGGHMEPASFRAIKPIHVFGNWGKKGNAYGIIYRRFCTGKTGICAEKQAGKKENSRDRHRLLAARVPGKNKRDAVM